MCNRLLQALYFHISQNPPIFKNLQTRNMSFIIPSQEFQPRQRRFPNLFYVHYDESYPGGRHTIGEHPGHTLFAMSLKATPGFLSHVELLDGSSMYDPQLAVATAADMLEAVVTIPPQDEDSKRFQANMSLNRTFPVYTYRFTMDIGFGANRHTEHFEWHHEDNAHGPGYPGFHLMRLSSPDVQVPAASYGQEWDELVAVLSWNHRHPRRVAFSFENSGATHRLGERWALLAVMTGLTLWDSSVRWSYATPEERRMWLGLETVLGPVPLRPRIGPVPRAYP
ncbi:hypothetical protein GGS26DRAFT_41264 [Hypomontagnella submonticulosa]|nr:hypothetical protein GGS26DRAFT_41264 [Hypomontagnella submonticulosa]